MGCKLKHTKNSWGCKLDRTTGAGSKWTPCTSPSVCKFYRDKMPSSVCIREIRELRKKEDHWFGLLVEDCQYHKDTLCHIPLHVHPITGMLMCTLKNCPLL